MSERERRVTSGTMRTARRAAMALAASVLAAFVSMYLPQPLLPDIARALAAPATAVAAIVSAVPLGIALTSPLLAPLSDRFGRRPLLQIATFGLVPANLACAVAPDLGTLLIVRGLEGAFIAIILSSGLAYLGEEFDREVATGLAGLFIASTAMGGVLSRVLGGAVGDAFGWRAAFVASAIVSVAAGIALLRLLPPAQRFRAATGAREAFRASLRHWQNPDLRRLYLVGFAIFFSFLGLFNALPYHLAGEPYGLAAGAIGLVYVVYIVGVASSTMTRRWLAWAGAPRGLALALAFTAVAHLATTAAPLAALLMALAGLCGVHFLAQSSASGLVTTRATIARAGATSNYLFAYYLGGSIGSLVSVALMRSVGWSAVAIVDALILVLAAVAAATLRP